MGESFIEMVLDVRQLIAPAGRNVCRNAIPHQGQASARRNVYRLKLSKL